MPVRYTQFMTEFVWDVDKPLARCKAEGKRANAAFVAYFNMGAGRNLRALADMFCKQVADNPQAAPPTTILSTINGWSFRNAWQARVARAEELRNEADELTLRDERLTRERRRMQRREEWEDREWALAQKLTGLAEEVLSEAPNYIKTKKRLVKGKNGQPDQLIVTLSLDGNMAVRAGDVASKLARLSTGSHTESVEIRNDDFTDETRADRIAEILDRARARRDQQVDRGGDGIAGESSPGGS